MLVFNNTANAKPVYVNAIPGIDGASKIATSKGFVAVQSLRPGDLVLTRDCGYQVVRWIMTPSCFDRMTDVLSPSGSFYSKLLLSQMSLTRDSLGNEHLTLLKLFPNDHSAVRAGDCYQILLSQHHLIMVDNVWTASLMFDDAIWQALPKEERTKITRACPNFNTSPNQERAPWMDMVRPFEATLNYGCEQIAPPQPMRVNA